MSVQFRSETDPLINPSLSTRVYGNMTTKDEIRPLNMDTFDRAGVYLRTSHSDHTLQSKSGTYIKKKIKMKQKSAVEFGGEIEEVPTTCFGDIEFRGVTRRSRAKFIRLSNDTSPYDIYKLMIKYWKMEPPRLLISVTGGAKAFYLDPILKQNFTVGLSKVASTPGCWVISGGTNAGVMKHVGEAIQGSTQACIGIATWGVINKRDSLNPDCRKPSVSSTMLQHCANDNKFIYEGGSWLIEEGAFLDSKHTHFLLVDDGSEGKFGVEIPFRGQFEKFIMKTGGRRGGDMKAVPAVLLVLEGGPGTLGTIHSAVSGKDPVPVVIVKSSGRAADLLVFALNLSEVISMMDSIGEKHDGLVNGISDSFPDLDDKKKERAYSQILECLQFKHMFTISQVATTEDMDDAILTALLSDSSTDTYRQLQLTLLWNRPDLARDKVLCHILQWGNENDPMELQWIMIMALAMDNVEFIELLLDYGVCISSFLTNELLEFLYGYRSFFKSSPLRYMSEFKEKDYKPVPAITDNRNIFNLLCQQHDDVTMSHVLLPRNLIEKLIEELCSSFIHVGDERFIEDIGEWGEDEKRTFQYPFRELFFWAILNNMQGMAVYFLKMGQEHMAKSIIGAQMCNALIDRRVCLGAMETSLSETRTLFKDGALQLLDECCRTDEKKTRMLITSSLEQFDRLSTLNLAVYSENLEFVSHYSVQGLLEDVWTGNIKMKEINLAKILFSYMLVFPILFNAFEFRTEEEILTTVQTEQAFEEETYEETDDEDDDSNDDDESKLSKWRIAKKRLTTRERTARIEKGEGTQLSMIRKLIEFYGRTPVVTFVAHFIGYIAFLILFSYVSMQQKTSPHPTIVEWFLIVTIIAFLVAEIYQVIQVDAPSLKARLYGWASSSLNVYDAFVIGLYFTALGMRLCLFSKNLKQIGHLLYAIDCGLWIFRLLSVCFISPTLGPYLVMIKRMSKDLLIFLSVLLVIIIGYGVITASILTPQKNFNIHMIRNPIWHPYFNIYGELFFDEPSDNSTTSFGTPVIDSYDETIIWILMGIYLLFTNILLLNLLIAVFNNTYNEVQAKSSQIWAFKRHQLIMEYADRHALFPPFSLLGHAALIIRWLYRKCAGSKFTDVSGLRSHVDDEYRESLLEFESKCMTVLSRRKFTALKKNVDGMVSQILEEMDVMKSEIEQIREK